MTSVIFKKPWNYVQRVMPHQLMAVQQLSHFQCTDLSEVWWETGGCPYSTSPLWCCPMEKAMVNTAWNRCHCKSCQNEEYKIRLPLGLSSGFVLKLYSRNLCHDLVCLLGSRGLKSVFSFSLKNYNFTFCV